MRSDRTITAFLLLGLTLAALPRGAAGETSTTNSPSAGSSGAAATQISTDPDGDGTSTGPAPASETSEAPAPVKLTVSGDVTVASKYLFQGLDYSQGRSVLQPDMVATMGPLSAVAWGNFQPDPGNINEIDLSLQYSGTVQRLSFTPGYTHLHYPNREGWDPSQEVFLNLALKAPLSPTLSIHDDFDSGRGLYSTLGLSQPLRGPLTAGLNVYYQAHYYDMTGVPSIEIKASGAWSFQTLTLTPSLSRFVTWNNGDFRDAAAVPSTWLFSLNVARTIF